MNFDDIDKLTSPEAKKKAEKVASDAKQLTIETAQAYHRLFKTVDGQRVLNDLTQKMIYENYTPHESSNVNYIAAYKNGESGVVKFIITQITKAEAI